MGVPGDPLGVPGKSLGGSPGGPLGVPRGFLESFGASERPPRTSWRAKGEGPQGAWGLKVTF